MKETHRDISVDVDIVMAAEPRFGSVDYPAIIWTEVDAQKLYEAVRERVLGLDNAEPWNSLSTEEQSRWIRASEEVEEAAEVSVGT